MAARSEVTRPCASSLGSATGACGFTPPGLGRGRARAVSIPIRVARWRARGSTRSWSLGGGSRRFGRRRRQAIGRGADRGLRGGSWRCGRLARRDAWLVGESALVTSQTDADPRRERQRDPAVAAPTATTRCCVSHRNNRAPATQPAAPITRSASSAEARGFQAGTGHRRPELPQPSSGPGKYAESRCAHGGRVASGTAIPPMMSIGRNTHCPSAWTAGTCWPTSR